MHIVEGR